MCSILFSVRSIMEDRLPNMFMDISDVRSVEKLLVNTSLPIPEV